MSSVEFEDLLQKYSSFITLNLNPNNTNKATVSINVRDFTVKKYKNTEADIIKLVTILGNIIKENNTTYNNLGTVFIDLKNVTRKNFSISYFTKIYKIIDKVFYKEDIVDKIICICNSNIPMMIWKVIKSIIDPDTVKKFQFYKV